MGNFPTREIASATTARASTFYSRETWIEGRAEDQLAHVAGWDGMAAVAAYPDLHPGRHGPVGAAFLADRIYPQLVGPDIGCGMALYKLDMHRRKLKIDKAARRLTSLEHGANPEDARSALVDAGLAGNLSPEGLGTIGGGNHFCEVQAVEEIFAPEAAQAIDLREGQLCLLVHSGSRSLGAGIFHELEARWARGYADGTVEARDYLELHARALAWARLNRRLVAEAAARALRTDLDLVCDAIHNHLERHPDGWLHRKGAAAPDRGLAPLAGSRETLSYLLKADKIPDDALGSLSHGAGRKYDRSSMHGRIRKTRSALAGLQKTRFGGQVICEDPALLIEEAGLAYKDARQVVNDLAGFGIAQPIASLAPCLTYKTVRTEDIR